MLDEADLPDVLEVAQVFPNYARDPVAAPDAVLGLVLREQRLRETAEAQQRVEIGSRRPRVELTQRERMQPEVTVAAGEGIPPLR